MTRMHRAMMKDVLLDVYQLGAASVEWRLIYRWFEAERITKRVWAELLEMWDEVLADHRVSEGYRLGRFDHTQTHILTLICMDPIGSKESMIRPIET